MRIIGLDCSTTATGWAIFEDNNLIAHGTIKPRDDNWRYRVAIISKELCGLIKQYKPVHIYVEDVPLKDGKSVLVKLGTMQGVVLTLAANFGIPITFILPANWRQPLGLFDGTRAGTHRDVLKEKAIKMVNEKFGLDLLWVAPKSKKNMDDEAEAILIAYSQIKNT